jgi:hypothetical protein
MAAGPFEGFAELRGPLDLLKKLEHDFKRLDASPANHYAAFDFFSTAEHLVDWLHPGKENKDFRKQLRNSSSILRVVSHVANGSKHFRADAPHHKSVESVGYDGYVEPGYVEDGYCEAHLLITLTEKEQTDIGMQTIDALELARRTLQSWREKLGIGSA